MSRKLSAESGADLLGDLFFGGAFPSLGSLPRLYTIHVVVIPASILGVLGISVWPYHALLAGQLVLLMVGAFSLLAASVPVHHLLPGAGLSGHRQNGRGAAL